MKYILHIPEFLKKYYNSIVYINTNHNEIKVKPWKEIRDYNVVKQNLDFSCCAASFATLLNSYYNQKSENFSLGAFI
jgi:hypothetical protein